MPVVALDPRFARNLAHLLVGSTTTKGGGGLFVVDATETFDGMKKNVKALHVLYISRLCRNLLQIVRRTEANTNQFDKLLDFLKRGKDISSKVILSHNIYVIAIYGTSVLFLGSTVSMARFVSSLKSMMVNEDESASAESLLEIAIQVKTLEAMLNSVGPVESS